MCGPAHGSAPPCSRTIAPNRVTTQQGDTKGFENFLETVYEAMIVSSEHMRQQHPGGFRPLGGEVGQVHRHQLPGDIGGVLPFENMNALDQGVMRQNKVFAAYFQNRGIILQVAGPCRGGEGAQAGDEVAFVQRPSSLATASRIPLTNFASRSSKKALATSTYSLIAAALGTSLRASSS